MTTVAVCMVLVTMLAVVPYWSVRLYEVPRNAYVAACGPVAFGLWSVSGAPVAVDPLVLSMAGGIVLLWAVGLCFAERAEIGLQAGLRFAGAMAVGLLVVPMADGRTILEALVLAACVHAAVSLAQRWFGLVIDPQVAQPAGLAGNTAWLGSYLAPHVLLALHLAPGAPWVWWPASILIMVALIETRCRAAMVGVAVGAALCSWWLFAACLVAGALLLWRRGWRRWRDLESMGLRRDIWQKSRAMLDWRVALIGLGVDQAKLRYWRTGYTHGRTNWYYGRHAHNDLVQWVLDSGAPGAALQLGIGVLTICRALAGGAPEAAAAVACILVAGLTLHIRHTTLTDLTWWCVVGWANALPAEGAVALPAVLSWAAAAVWLALAVRIWGGIAVADTALRRMQGEQDIERRAKLATIAGRAAPRDPFVAMVRLDVAVRMHRQGDTFSALAAMWAHYDADVHPGKFFLASGQALMEIGAVQAAREALTLSLRFDPRQKGARQRLDAINQAIVTAAMQRQAMSDKCLSEGVA